MQQNGSRRFVFNYIFLKGIRTLPLQSYLEKNNNNSQDLQIAYMEVSDSRKKKIIFNENLQKGFFTEKTLLTKKVNEQKLPHDEFFDLISYCSGYPFKIVRYIIEKDGLILRFDVIRDPVLKIGAILKVFSKFPGNDLVQNFSLDQFTQEDLGNFEEVTDDDTFFTANFWKSFCKKPEKDTIFF